MYSSGMAQNRTEAEGPKVVRVAISPELRDRINDIRVIERRNMTNMVEILLLEALDAREGVKK